MEHLRGDDLTMSAIARAKLLADLEALPEEDKEKLKLIVKKYDGLLFGRHGATKFQSRSLAMRETFGPKLGLLEKNFNEKRERGQARQELKGEPPKKKSVVVEENPVFPEREPSANS